MDSVYPSLVVEVVASMVGHSARTIPHGGLQIPELNLTIQRLLQRTGPLGPSRISDSWPVPGGIGRTPEDDDGIQRCHDVGTDGRGVVEPMFEI